MTTNVRGRLPNQLRPSQSVEMIRLGGPRDGGYLLNEADVLASDSLISMGIDKDWQFERDFVRLNPVPVHAYDGCTNVRYLLDDTRRAFGEREWKWLVRTLEKVGDYFLFFSGARKHYRSFVGTSEYAYHETSSPTVSLAEVFARMKGQMTFLKIDIEGAEYGLLDDLVTRSATGLAIEFHDCDEHIEEIISFVERYPLTLIHVHANPYGGVGTNGMPKALELTFSFEAQRTEREPVLPHPLDAANDGKEEIPLHFGT